MTLRSNQREPKQSRFTLPNDIWSYKLPPPAFSILTYLRYLDCHHRGTPPDAGQLAKHLRMSEKMAKTQMATLLSRGLVTRDMRPRITDEYKKFFSLPNELFALGLRHGAVTVYAYLLYCEDRRTHQCHPSYKTISASTGLAVNTVMKHIGKLEDRQLISVEHTSYLDNNGMKWNSNNRYTILPICQAVDRFYQCQLAELDLATEHQRIASLLSAGESPA